MSFIRRDPPQWTELLRQQAKPRDGVHVTSCLGCPRRDALMREGATVDLAWLESRLTGTILHKALAEINPETAEINVSGRLFGMDVVGSIDRLEDGFVCDYKAGEGKGEGKQMPDAPYPDQVWQMETYRYLLALPAGPNGYTCDTAGWRIYYRWDKAWYMFEHVGPIWTEDQLGAFRPHQGAFTTREIGGQVAAGLSASHLPLVGATQRIGKGMACAYCEVEGPCNEMEADIEL